ncbi:Trm112 family protein [Zafaria sp. Z1313]|uniref:Trm112 family protein n=1 Tax=unclassified Zafaria TaxID=2828765 RepID=UPI002E792627|nr:hypothetical protein [Zafaria sp. J156]MEE1619951.1 hypothetical protein [Zafaria sp. J156]
MAHIPPQLLAVLRCPVTGSTLVRRGDELVSTVPGPGGEPLCYAVQDGIPVLLPTPAETTSDPTEQPS